MERDCEIIRDILPLYADEVCSDASRALVEEHLKTCAACREILATMTDDTADQLLNNEKQQAIAKQAWAFKRKGAVVGTVFAAILAVPVLVCLIVNLATGHGLSWFFIVLAALLLAASLLVVPLLAPKNKFFYTVAASCASLLVLLGVCALFSGGRWWGIASSASLFGLGVLLLPILVNQPPCREIFSPHKALTVLAADTLLYGIMMAVIGLRVRSATYAANVLRISLPIILLVLLTLLIFRYLKANGWIKTGAVHLMLSVFGLITDGTMRLINGELPIWRDIVMTSYYWNEGALTLATNAVLAIIGLFLLLIGFLTGKGKKHEKNR